MIMIITLFEQKLGKDHQKSSKIANYLGENYKNMTRFHNTKDQNTYCDIPELFLRHDWPDPTTITCENKTDICKQK